MSPSDFDDLAELWTQEPAAEERRAFESLARTVSRRARLLYYAELGIAFFLVIGVLIALFLDRNPATAALVVLVVAAIGWSSWRRFHVQRVALLVDSRDRQSLLAGAVKSAEGRLRHSTLGLVLLVPSFLLGFALRGTIVTDFEFVMRTLERSLREPAGLVGIVAITLLLAHFIRQNIHLRRELKQLRALQAEFREEEALEQ